MAREHPIGLLGKHTKQSSTHKCGHTREHLTSCGTPALACQESRAGAAAARLHRAGSQGLALQLVIIVMQHATTVLQVVWLLSRPNPSPPSRNSNQPPLFSEHGPCCCRLSARQCANLCDVQIKSKGAHGRLQWTIRPLRCDGCASSAMCTGPARVPFFGGLIADVCA